MLVLWLFTSKSVSWRTDGQTDGRGGNNSPSARLADGIKQLVFLQVNFLIHTTTLQLLHFADKYHFSHCGLAKPNQYLSCNSQPIVSKSSWDMKLGVKWRQWVVVLHKYTFLHIQSLILWVHLFTSSWQQWFHSVLCLIVQRIGISISILY